MKLIKIAGFIESSALFSRMERLCNQLDNATLIGNTNRQALPDFLHKNTIDLLLIHTGHHLPAPENHDLLTTVIPDPASFKSFVFLKNIDSIALKEHYEAGFHGLVSEKITLRELQYILNTLSIYGFYISQAFLKNLVNTMQIANDSKTHHVLFREQLNTIEQEIMELIYRNYTPTQMARQLSISPHAVQYHRKNILRKIHLKSNDEIVRFLMCKKVCDQFLFMF